MICASAHTMGSSISLRPGPGALVPGGGGEVGGVGGWGPPGPGALGGGTQAARKCFYQWFMRLHISLGIAYIIYLIFYYTLLY